MSLAPGHLERARALRSERLRALWIWCAALTFGTWFACGFPLALLVFVAAVYVIRGATTRPPAPNEPEERGGCV